MIIPFQIFIDILFVNMIQLFYKCDILPYLVAVNLRFKNRISDWLVNDDFVRNKYLEDLFANMDRWGFTTQFYMLLSLNCFAGVYILLGIMTIIYQQYSVFYDYNAITVILFWYLFCKLVQYVLVKIGLLIKLWRVKPQKTAGAIQQF